MFLPSVAFLFERCSTRSMAILEHARNNTPYRLYANCSPEGPLSNRDSCIAGIILRIEKIYTSILLFTNNNDHNEKYILCP